ncbi:hypothetical protein INR49_017196 [Caranx melampygus]|nr:hypothetical protein INR49_017196 [Caranx melampygus]
MYRNGLEEMGMRSPCKLSGLLVVVMQVASLSCLSLESFPWGRFPDRALIWRHCQVTAEPAALSQLRPADCEKSVKEGILLKQTSSFQRWKRRYFKLRGRTLYYAKDCKSLIFDEVDLSDASVAETSTKNINNSFTVITPFRK